MTDLDPVRLAAIQAQARIERALSDRQGWKMTAAELDREYLLAALARLQGENAETLKLWREQDDALQRIWGALGIYVAGGPTPAQIADAVDGYIPSATGEVARLQAERDEALADMERAKRAHIGALELEQSWQATAREQEHRAEAAEAARDEARRILADLKAAFTPPAIGSSGVASCGCCWINGTRFPCANHLATR